MRVLQERKPVRSWAIADTASEPAIDRMRKLADWLVKYNTLRPQEGRALKTLKGLA